MPDNLNQPAVLVAYATHAGSTQEVAEAIAAELRQNGLSCDLKKAREVRSLEGYSAVVLGAPLYIFHWLGDAKKFLKQHRAALASRHGSGRPLAIFALGPMNDDDKETKGAREQLDKDLLQFPWLKPVDIQIFGGRYDPAKLHFPYSLMMAMPANPMKQIPASDVRNWAQIKAWAGMIANKFKTL